MGQYIEALKAPNNAGIDCKDYYDDEQYVEYEENEYEENEEYEYDENGYDEKNDLENAPMLDLHELDEEESFHGVEDRGDPDIAFWTEQPPSPKKQINAQNEHIKDKFKEDENEKNMEMKEDEVPEITNNDPNLPIPPKFDVNFKFLKPANIQSSHFDIISPRNNEKEEKIEFEQKQSAELRVNILNEPISEQLSTENNEEYDESLKYDENENNHFNVIQQRLRNKTNNKMNKNGRILKGKSRETVTSKEDIYGDLEMAESEETTSGHIITFNVNNNMNSNKLDNILEIHDDDFAEDENEDLLMSKLKKSASLEVDSPKSIKNRSISPRNIIDHIIKLSPRSKDKINSDDKEIQQLLIPQHHNSEFV